MELPDHSPPGPHTGIPENEKDSRSSNFTDNATKTALSMKLVSTGKASGLTSLKKICPPTSRNYFADFLNLRSYSGNDDGSIASKILSLTKSGSTPSSGPRSSSSFSPKIRGVRLECCTEGLGAESSDVSASSLPPSDAKEGKEIKMVGAKDSSFFYGGSCDGNCTAKRNRDCLPERVKTLKGNGKFPPPLSTLTRGGYPHLLNGPLVSLRPLRMDGRFVLQEVRVPCRADLLRASRKDGRLRLELVKENCESNFDLPTAKACKEDCLLEEIENREKSLKTQNGLAFSSVGASTNLNIEMNSREGRRKEDNMSDLEVVLTDVVQEKPVYKLEMSDSAAMKDRLEEGLVVEGSHDSTEQGTPNLSILSISNKRENIGFSSTSGSTSILAPPTEQMKSPDTFQLSVEDDGTEPINLDLDSQKDQLLQVAKKERHVSEETSARQEEVATQERQEHNSKLSARCSLSESGIHNFGDEQIKEEECSALAAKSGSIDDDTTFSSTISDFPFSLPRLQAGILNNSEARHASCKNGLDGNKWEKGVPPLVGLQLHC